MIFLVQVHDACSDDDDVLTFESAEDAAKALGIEWKAGYEGSKVTHRAEIPRGNWHAYEDDSYTAEDIARDNEHEAVYASGLYAKPGKRVDFDD